MHPYLMQDRDEIEAFTEDLDDWDQFMTLTFPRRISFPDARDTVNAFISRIENRQNRYFSMFGTFERLPYSDVGWHLHALAAGIELPPEKVKEFWDRSVGQRSNPSNPLAVIDGHKSGGGAAGYIAKFWHSDFAETNLLTHRIGFK